MFTLGLAPYAWLQPSELIEHLAAGQRLDKPELADDEMLVYSLLFTILTKLIVILQTDTMMVYWLLFRLFLFLLRLKVRNGKLYCKMMFVDIIYSYSGK